MSPSPEAPITTSELHDDIFGSAPTSPSLSPSLQNNDIQIPAQQLLNNTANSERSDIPRLRSVHVTAGYRDGISVSKAEHVQHGFDEGFSLGAVIGVKAGFLLGVLEGVVRAVQSSASSINDKVKQDVIAKFVAARQDLGLQSLFAREWFGEDGIWKFEVEGRDQGEVTFRDVADAHPVIGKWTTEIDELKKRFGVEFQMRATSEGDDEEETTA
ncbi:essential protein-like protein Yae1 [Aureobasidium sp. EXF-12298]|nr:essential protein-like protein Yae1 [Aureobasidium sp. EXF-12298]KAI4759607.1 essential protein-like protein Yae1 [Aureobasidium sp. EXF-12344]KAI4781798.1 essential protein-like protein Yae1 [Aureobasidium sp. EXF-3400]